MSADLWNHPHLGYGAALVRSHFDQALKGSHGLDVFEVVVENLLETQGYARYAIEQLSERTPVLLHAVGLSIGGTDPLDLEYLRGVKKLAQRVGARFFSDHVCWTGRGGHVVHDFLPVPHTEEALAHVVQRIRVVQDCLEMPLVLENSSTYMGYTLSSMPEWEFFSRMAEEANCGLLLDVNAVYTSSYNHGFDPRQYIDALPIQRIVYQHLAGHTNHGSWFGDTHSSPVTADVWTLYRYAEARTGGRTTLVVWDGASPEFPVLQAEVEKLRKNAKKPLKKWMGPPPPSVRQRSPGSLVPAAARPSLSLSELQAQVHSFIVEPERPADGHAGGAISTMVVPRPQLTGIQRLDSYRRQYWNRMREEMGYYFYQVKRFLGPELFGVLAHDYVRRYPPDHWNILRLRHRFPAFLRQFGGDKVLCSGFVYDLARLEVALRDIADEPRSTVLTIADVDAVGPEEWEGATLRFIEPLRLLAFQHAVNAYSLGQTGATGDLPSVAPDFTLPNRNWLVVFQQNYVTYRLPLGAHVYRLLRLLQKGVSVGVSVRRVGSEEDLTDELLKFLRSLVQGGMIRRMELAQTTSVS